jgi:hypothetical protein
VKPRTGIILAAAAVAALAVSGTASASTAAVHPGSIIRATGVRPGAISHISSSTGTLGLKGTNTYADQESENWSGYTTPAVDGAYSETSTTFTVPTDVACGSTDTASAFWAGLDGDTSSSETVEQDGVEADCTGGVQSLYGWVELFPAYQQEIVNETTGAPAPVEPGDTVISTVEEISPSEYYFYVRDETQGWYISTDEDMPAGYTGEDQTSEVITEAPTECSTPTTCQELPLTNFGSVGYYNTLYNASAADWYTSSNTIKIDLYENGTTETDSVGALGADGAFTVTYGTPPPVDKVTVTNPGSQSTTAGAAAALQIRATSSEGEAISSYAASGLPSGLSVNRTTGLISGTPKASGTYHVKVTATDTTGTSGSASFTWTVKKLGAPKPRLCGRSGTVLHVCWAAVAHATSYAGLIYRHGHSFSTKGLSETFRGLKRRTAYKLRMHASNAAGSSATVVLTVRTK